MKILTSKAILLCDHGGLVAIKNRQSFVTIHRRPVLVETDPEGKSIAPCPYYGVGVVPCNLTRRVEKGYSGLLKIKNRRVCLDTVKGKTNGQPPPDTFYYTVKSPGQDFVSEK